MRLYWQLVAQLQQEQSAKAGLRAQRLFHRVPLAKARQARQRTRCMEQRRQVEAAHRPVMVAAAAVAEVPVHRLAVAVHPAMAAAVPQARLHPVSRVVLLVVHQQATQGEVEAPEARPRVVAQVVRSQALTRARVQEAASLVLLQELLEALPEARSEQLSAERQQAPPGLLLVA